TPFPLHHVFDDRQVLPLQPIAGSFNSVGLEAQKRGWLVRGLESRNTCFPRSQHQNRPAWSLSAYHMTTIDVFCMQSHDLGIENPLADQVKHLQLDSSQMWIADALLRQRGQCLREPPMDAFGGDELDALPPETWCDLTYEF